MKNFSSYILVLFFVVVSTSQFYARPQSAIDEYLKFCREEGIFSEVKKVRKESLLMIFEQADVLALPYLIERLNSEPEEDIQMYIARIIKKLDDVEGIRALEKFAWSDGSVKVRWVCRSICKEYAMNNSSVYSFNLARLDELLKSEMSSQ